MYENVIDASVKEQCHIHLQKGLQNPIIIEYIKRYKRTQSSLPANPFPSSRAYWLRSMVTNANSEETAEKKKKENKTLM